MLSDWAERCDGESQMNLAIAVDAKPVAGNPAIFKASRNWFMRHLRNNDVFFSHFAKASLEFDTPLTFFGNLKDKGQLDIKKGGIFPIVHGIRTIAIEYRVKATNTFERIEALVEVGAQTLSTACGEPRPGSRQTRNPLSVANHWQGPTAPPPPHSCFGPPSSSLDVAEYFVIGCDV